jgi:hypothetical protein
VLEERCVDAVFSKIDRHWDYLVLPRIEVLSKDSSWVQEQQERALAAAEANLDLADSLSRKPNTQATQDAWLSLIDNLDPGPYSSYLVKKIGSLAKEAGPVRDQLLKIFTRWTEKYSDKIFYSNELGELRTALDAPKSIISRLFDFFKR